MSIKKSAIVMVNESLLSRTDPAKLDSASIAGWSFVNNDPESIKSWEEIGWVRVGKAEIEIEFDSSNGIVGHAIDAFSAQQKAIQAKATLECNALEKRKQELLALPMGDI